MPLKTIQKCLFFPIILCSLLLSGCLFDQFSKDDRDERFGSIVSNPEQDMRFRAFVGRLRTAVASRDYQTMRSMMTSNFGFDLASEYEGPDNAFAYWTQHNLWFELERVLNEDFELKGYFLVAPASFAKAEEEFAGFRAGITDTRNGFRFAYFVDEFTRPFYAPGEEPGIPAGTPDSAPRVSTMPGNNPVPPVSNPGPGPFRDAQILEP